jgi:hypothetical protein
MPPGLPRALRETLATKFNGAMLSHVSVASVVAEGVVFASGESFERVATSLDLTVAAGPRALASLEMARSRKGPRVATSLRGERGWTD